MQVAVHYLPQFVSEAELAGGLVVVVDLLRASTTICHALAAGAKCVVPCVEVAETWEKAAGNQRSRVLLGGERGGERIEGFDLGNSPGEYTADVVFGREVFFTTTNGTRALAHARLAERVVIGAAVNRASLANAVRNQPRVDILCAGTGGQVTREDILAAGAICEGLGRHAATEFRPHNSWTEAALREWQELTTLARASGQSVAAQLTEELRLTTGGKNLLAIGHDTDLEICAQLDTLTVVPELDRRAGRIEVP